MNGLCKRKKFSAVQLFLKWISTAVIFFRAFFARK